MIRNFGKVKLPGGEVLTVKCIEPPEAEYADKLSYFFRYKRDDTLRNITERVRGCRAADSIDRYFVGELGGKIASLVWYGLPRIGFGVGNFGNTQTAPEHRRKGIMKILMKFLVEDFRAGRGVALFCSSGKMTAEKIYEPFGFEFVSRNSSGGGRMMNLKKEYAGSLEELEELYFEKGCELSVRRGNSADHFIFDRFMPNTRGFRSLSGRWHSVFLCSQVKNYIDALFRAEDGFGELLTAEIPGGRAVGYAFILFIGSPAERKCAAADFFIHPSYLSTAGEFLGRALSEAAGRGIGDVRTYVNSGDKEKLCIFRGCGFTEEFRLADYCSEDGKDSDVIGLRRSRHSSWGDDPGRGNG